MTEVCPECHGEACPLWAALRTRIATETDGQARTTLREQHAVLDSPCVTCGQTTYLCNIFYCYAPD